MYCPVSYPCIFTLFVRELLQWKEKFDKSASPTALPFFLAFDISPPVFAPCFSSEQKIFLAKV
jgi:hypothetical protein